MNLNISITGCGSKDQIISALHQVLNDLQDRPAQELSEHPVIWEDATLLTQINPAFDNTFSAEEAAVLKAWRESNFSFPAPSNVSEIKHNSFEGSWSAFKRTIMNL